MNVPIDAEASQSTRDAALELVSALKDNHIAATLYRLTMLTSPVHPCILKHD
jgi:hypothetical protein